jgi:cytoskeletal protein CcmA (bactofilin family)
MTDEYYSSKGSNNFSPNPDGSYDGQIDGVTNFAGGQFKRLRVDGVCTSNGPITAESLEVRGIFTCKGAVTSKHFDCDGVATFEGDLKTSTSEIDGVVNVHGTSIEADEIRCGGVLNIKGQISADNIKANGFVNASEIVGDRIEILSQRKSFFFQLWLKLKDIVGAEDRSEVDLIEGTTVILRGVKAREVNGHDVNIGELCEIGKVSATGQLIVDPTAKIGETVGA